MKGCRPLTDGEVSAVLNAFKGKHALRNRALFTLGVYTGFRISELLSIKIKQVWQYGQVLDHVTVDRQYCKGKKEGQTVPIHRAAKAALRVLIEAYGDPDPGQYLFLSQKGDNRAITRNQAYDVLKAVYKALQMMGKVATHSMRKTFAVRVHDRLGHDLMKTKEALRHRSIDSTVKYLSCNNADIDQAILGD